ncbi:MAG TPA: alpha-L-arabinofuranosidase C-terminal domain-containing protein [Niabella sp.]|nr:alpha-L-arabinofuranosidase C-terminal domain-containing protein [Niabella sp.]HOZ97864.1 alpha-L-arabinofuranosidase C-terminal domain-containing protein [Niabella sp.]HQW13723.1 alpha-L-arabinofuranosidase C-terminal domain-containing protein [Niabella sp.]HRB06407.1 alpha-L-arabinofuranosidase C-terminal domain-containing protein [Niabella sp.]HRB34269.1 alpha-L-arabinofuranosidase C-terminal domain-containing protein [Niabella sp.]
MEKLRQFTLLALSFLLMKGALAAPDSAYLFAYTKVQNEGKTGLMFAWSNNQETWHEIGKDFGFVKSDYGQWGSEKRMFAPVLFRESNGLWHCIWKLNKVDQALAYTYSKDLLSWYPQTYVVNENDLKVLTPERIKQESSKLQQVQIQNEKQTGTISRVPWGFIERLIEKVNLTNYNNQLWYETTKEDPIRFASLKPIDVTIVPDFGKKKKISDMLIGVFFEDINYGADGGLYGELIQNRGFEYQASDVQNRDKTWNEKKAWTTRGDGIDFSIQSSNPIHPNNKNYAQLSMSQPGGVFINEGFDGIAIVAGEKYDCSFFAQHSEKRRGDILIKLTNDKGDMLASSKVNLTHSDWKKYNLILLAKQSAKDARLEIIPQFSGTLALDMISLFPQRTFKNRKNGLRADLAQVIADLHPRFIRFPGGCVAHGDGIENIYHWKNTVGPVETRKPQRNMWNYHQTAGLGYFEYFQFCEDIGAAPLPVVAAGVPCQNSAKHGHPLGGQQCGIPMEKMNDYVQDVLDLIEWANGDAKSKWGSVRAAAGHPKPFGLKYIGIGNEDLISDVFTERFTLIYHAVKAKYPDIIIIGTVGPFFEGSDYKRGWELASQLSVPMVDEHYYVPPGWMIYNQDYYDKYDRSKSQVYLGEYAAHLPGRPNNLETALAEAIHLTNLERNADIVHMSSYAPLLAKEGHTQWSPDLIFFDNTTVTPTTGYYVQQLFGRNAGDEYITANFNSTINDDKVRKRIAYSIVRDSETKDIIIKMVNMLPVGVNVSLDLKEITFNNPRIEKFVLSGKPDEKNLKPVTSDSSVQELEKIGLKPYSFTLFRVSQ